MRPDEMSDVWLFRAVALAAALALADVVFVTIWLIVR